VLDIHQHTFAISMHACHLYMTKRLHYSDSTMRRDGLNMSETVYRFKF